MVFKANNYNDRSEYGVPSEENGYERADFKLVCAYKD